MTALPTTASEPEITPPRAFRCNGNPIVHPPGLGRQWRSSSHLADKCHTDASKRIKRWSWQKVTPEDRTFLVSGSLVLQNPRTSGRTTLEADPLLHSSILI